MARIKLSQGDAGAAMELIDGASSEVGFEALFAEIRGDIHLAEGREEQAVESYKTATQELQEGIGNREFLRIKLEALGYQYSEETPVVIDTGGGEM